MWLGAGCQSRWLAGDAAELGQGAANVGTQDFDIAGFGSEIGHDRDDGEGHALALDPEPAAQCNEPARKPPDAFGRDVDNGAALHVAAAVLRIGCNV